jgi:hypothetical protein
VLAGNVLTLDLALAIFVAFSGAPLEQGLRLLMANPAAMTGLVDWAGLLAVGRRLTWLPVTRRGSELLPFKMGGSLPPNQRINSERPATRPEPE